MGDVDRAGLYICVGGRVYIGNLCVFHGFYYENKEGLKNESIKKI